MSRDDDRIDRHIQAREDAEADRLADALRPGGSGDRLAEVAHNPERGMAEAERRYALRRARSGGAR